MLFRVTKNLQVQVIIKKIKNAIIQDISKIEKFYQCET
jgi:hypothetical protein